MDKKLLNDTAKRKVKLTEQLEEIGYNLSVMSDAIAILSTSVVRAQRDLDEISQHLMTIEAK